MISRVRVVRFKRFADHDFDLSGDTILLAGPNNSGKTTLLHAVAAWHLALKRWLAERRGSGGKKRSSAPKLDIANAGSGFHQVLLLLSFFHARPSSILLLDGPDAHLHFILQREIFDLLRTVAQRRACKLIVATHAESCSTEPTRSRSSPLSVNNRDGWWHRKRNSVFARRCAD